MTKTVLQITNAKVRLAEGATKPTDWETVDDGFSCQVTSASIDATPVTVSVPATFCEGETEVVGKSRWTLNLEGLQDWTVAAGLSMFLFENETKQGWAQVIIPTGDPGDPIATAEVPVRFAAGSFAGRANDPLTFTVALPCQARPTITAGTVPATP